MKTTALLLLLLLCSGCRYSSDVEPWRILRIKAESCEIYYKDGHVGRSDVWDYQGKFQAAYNIYTVSRGYGFVDYYRKGKEIHSEELLKLAKDFIRVHGCAERLES